MTLVDPEVIVYDASGVSKRKGVWKISTTTAIFLAPAFFFKRDGYDVRHIDDLGYGGGGDVTFRLVLQSNPLILHENMWISGENCLSVISSRLPRVGRG